MSIQKFVVSRDESVYHAWPDLVLTEKGKLICVFTETTHHLNRADSRIAICESTDRGRTWTGKKYLTEKTQIDNYYNNSRIKRMSDNSLIILCDRIKVDENKSGIVYMWKGDSEGIDFGEPIETPARGIVPDKLGELKCGRWILASHTKNDETDKLEQYMWYSDDKGKTWSDKIVIGADPRYNLCEVSIVELDDETLVGFMRENSLMGYDCMKSISHDHGKTWEGVYNVPIPACHRPVSGILQNGIVMISHRFIQGGGREVSNGAVGFRNQNMFAAFMTQESAQMVGRDKQAVRIMPIDYDRSPVSDLGYTGWVQFDDGEIYMVNYIVDDASKAQIRGYSFYYSDVVLG